VLDQARHCCVVRAHLAVHVLTSPLSVPMGVATHKGPSWFREHVREIGRHGMHKRRTRATAIAMS